jgi:hypothetical protein
MWKASSSLTI